MTKIISISIDDLTDRAIKQYGLRPSAVFRHAVRRHTMPAFRNEEESAQKIALLSQKLDKIFKYLDERGLSDDVLAKTEGKAGDERGIREAQPESNGFSDDAGGNEAQNSNPGDGNGEIEV